LSIGDYHNSEIRGDLFEYPGSFELTKECYYRVNRVALYELSCLTMKLLETDIEQISCFNLCWTPYGAKLFPLGVTAGLFIEGFPQQTSSHKVGSMSYKTDGMVLSGWGIDYVTDEDSYFFRWISRSLKGTRELLTHSR